MTFGEHLAELLHERGLSRIWLAAQLQIDASVVDAWFSDAQQPGSSTTVLLAEAIGVPMEVLMPPHHHDVHHRRRTFYRSERFWRRSKL